MTNHLNVYELPIATNVCAQVLREVMALNQVGFAHVAMQPKAVSLLHQHLAMSEIYFILKGEGILYHGDKALEVTKGAYQVIPPQTPHKLRNIGDSSLEHLVFAVPPFDSADVHLVDDVEKQYSLQKPRQHNITISQDGTFIYELLSSQERQTLGMGLAFGILPPGKKAIAHYHKIIEEVYYVISGEGKLFLNNSTYNLQKGDVIHVPINTVHGLESSALWGLKILCMSSPAYMDEDFIKK